MPSSEDQTCREFVFAPPERQRGVLKKAAALLEAAVVIGASVAAVVFGRQFITPSMGETLGLATGDAPDLVASAFALAKQFALQYGALIVLVVAIAVVRGRTAPRAYALTTAGARWSKLVLLGVVGGALAALPSQMVFVAKEIWPLGADTPLWAVIESVEWDWRFWLFMAVGSFALVPILEEFAWRSYALGRLVEAFRPGGALIVTALIFAGLHTQYLASGDALGYLTMSSVVFAALVFGALTLKTGSVYPAVIAHMIVNTPKSFEIGVAAIVIYAAIILIAHRAILQWMFLFARDALKTDTAIAIALIVSLAGVGIAAAAQSPFALYAAVGAALLAFIAFTIFVRSAWTDRTP